ncbi:hypothetical protein V441_28770 [Pseudomonas aeruginosa DHS29]|jgi:hypothetical protein|nr:hypothetical protein PADK2_25060 [Pseudomonas aeruginosa DK2]AGO43687.1 hypothetical protein M062_24870 [Pseudomonas aeruginosa RP73]AHC67741.1 hypothetical protein T223_26110 [Pseudomonas aeruginosa LES431]AHK85971.1 hypothetical protein T227_26060 [Pseudomonas aeruginosa LESlike5]AHK91851.1 hypothetical protein T228_25635 [Pseudomonas aeruginosa LESlike7]AHK97846.1 hypothetical protein T222_26445 [Pseudomonas aeruginosa LES400]AHL03812.1 hypothetical protein T224_26045 [Pseudomonas aerug
MMRYCRKPGRSVRPDANAYVNADRAGRASRPFREATID